MATTRANVQDALATPVQVKVRPITAAIAALIAIAAVTLAIALAASSGGSSDDAGPVRVVPSAQNVPTPDERNQDPALSGPGMRP